MALKTELTTESGIHLDSTYSRIGRITIDDSHAVSFFMDHYANKDIRLNGGSKVQSDYIQTDATKEIKTAVDALISTIYRWSMDKFAGASAI